MGSVWTWVRFPLRENNSACTPSLSLRKSMLHQRMVSLCLVIPLCLAVPNRPPTAVRDAHNTGTCREVTTSLRNDTNANILYNNMQYFPSVNLELSFYCIAESIEVQRLKLLGHLNRMFETSWPKQIWKKKK